VFSKWDILDCGGKRSATPLLTIERATPCESAVAAALCRRTPRRCARHDAPEILEASWTAPALPPSRRDGGWRFARRRTVRKISE